MDALYNRLFGPADPNIAVQAAQAEVDAANKKLADAQAAANVGQSGTIPDGVTGGRKKRKTRKRKTRRSRK